MALPVSNQKQRQVPSGRTYLDLYQDGVPNGHFRYVGLNYPFNLNVASASIQIFTAEDGVAELDDETLTQVTRGGQFAVRQINVQNIAMFVIGTFSEASQTDSSVTDEAHTVGGDSHFWLGAGGVARNVSSVVITSADGNTTYDVNDDYEIVNAATGHLYIVPGGAIAIAAAGAGGQIEILADYDKEAVSWEHVESAGLASLTASIRIEAAPMKGTPRDWRFPKVTLRPSGDMPLKVDPESPAYATLTWDIAIQQPDDGGPAVLMDGRALA